MHFPIHRISNFFIVLSNQWYFTLIIGLVFLFPLVGGIFAYRLLSTSHSNSSTSLPATTTPTSSPTASPNSGFEKIIESTPTPRVTPKPPTTSKPATSPTPTTSPTSTPSPTVRITYPEHQHNYSGDSIEIKMEVITSKKIDRFEIIINGSARETYTTGALSYTKTINLGAGAYRLQGKAFFSDGTDLSSGELRFGLGGTDWNYSPTPTPSPTPTATTSALLHPTLLASK